MKDFIKRLPIDIILKIIPYTYNLQNKNLLCDIINFKELKTSLLELYHKRWIIEAQGYPNEDKDWLINDIFGYANNYNAGMYGYIDNFYNIFKRNIFLKLNEHVDNYVYNLEGKNVSSQINIFLGLLTVNERNEMLLHCQNNSN